MTVAYFRALAHRCQTAARNSFDLAAKEKFRSLAQELNAKADQLARTGANSGAAGSLFGSWFPRIERSILARNDRLSD